MNKHQDNPIRERKGDLVLPWSRPFLFQVRKLGLTKQKVSVYGKYVMNRHRARCFAQAFSCYSPNPRRHSPKVMDEETVALSCNLPGSHSW